MGWGSEAKPQSCLAGVVPPSSAVTLWTGFTGRHQGLGHRHSKSKPIEQNPCCFHDLSILRITTENGHQILLVPVPAHNHPPHKFNSRHLEVARCPAASKTSFFAEGLEQLIRGETTALYSDLAHGFQWLFFWSKKNYDYERSKNLGNNGNKTTKQTTQNKEATIWHYLSAFVLRICFNHLLICFSCSTLLPCCAVCLGGAALLPCARWCGTVTRIRPRWRLGRCACSFCLDLVFIPMYLQFLLLSKFLSKNFQTTQTNNYKRKMMINQLTSSTARKCWYYNILYCLTDWPSNHNISLWIMQCMHR